MRRFLLLLVLVPSVAPVDAAPRRRPGRVVRIERPRHAAADPIHVCIPTGLEEGKLTCYGKEPQVGSRVQLLNDSGERSDAVVRATAPSVIMDSCRTGTAHDVTLDQTGPAIGASYGFMGVTLSDRARTLGRDQAPQLPVRDQLSSWLVLDRDGNQTADMVVTGEECPAEAEAGIFSPNGRALRVWCLDYWLDDGQGYARAARDLIYMCQS